MLFLLFRVGEERYVVDTARIVEVLPLVHCKRLPRAPAGVAGVFNYHGTPVPLIDLTALITKRPSRNWMSTRIIVVNRGTETSSGARLLGLLAEQVTGTLHQAEQGFRHPGMASPKTPFLGPIAVRADGMIQRLVVENLLPPEIERELFADKTTTTYVPCER